MRPRKVHPFGSMQHRERPATHNVGLVGLLCCGELELYVERGLIWEACARCGKRIGKWGVIPSPPEPQLQQPYDDTEDDVDGATPWLG